MSGEGTDEQWMSVEGDSPTPTPTWYLQDRQASVIGVSDASGAITPYTYGPYGEPQSWAGSRFRYTGQIAIPEAQLYHYRARAYDPVMGRFLQTDPIGYDDGPNIYAYVHGDPVNATDPSGNGYRCGSASVDGYWSTGTLCWWDGNGPEPFDPSRFLDISNGFPSTNYALQGRAGSERDVNSAVELQLIGLSDSFSAWGRIAANDLLGGHVWIHTGKSDEFLKGRAATSRAGVASTFLDETKAASAMDIAYRNVNPSAMAALAAGGVRSITLSMKNEYQTGYGFDRVGTRISMFYITAVFQWNDVANAPYLLTIFPDFRPRGPDDPVDTDELELY